MTEKTTNNSDEAVGPGPEVAAAPHRLGYQPALDGVRAIAILAVIAFHTGRGWFGSGYYGVDAFFVLSGFLITTLLLQEHSGTGRISLRLFYARRAARLFPALFVTCTFVLIVALLNVVASIRPALTPTSTKVSLTGVAFSLAYVASWVDALGHNHLLGAMEHTWSLSVEEWFYALWPLLLILILRRSRWVTWLTVASALAAIGYRLLSEQVISSKMYLYTAPDQRACQLLAGCATAAIMVGHGSRVTRHTRALWWLGVAGAAGVGVLLGRPAAEYWQRSVPGERWGVVLVALATAAILASSVALPGSALARVLSLRPLVWIGRRSYGLYLYHLPLMEYVSPRYAPSGHIPLQRGLLAIALTFVVAAVSYRWLEQPAIRWMRKREQRVRGNPPRAPAVAPIPALAD